MEEICQNSNLPFPRNKFVPQVKYCWFSPVHRNHVKQGYFMRAMKGFHKILCQNQALEPVPKAQGLGYPEER